MKLTSHQLPYSNSTCKLSLMPSSKQEAKLLSYISNNLTWICWHDFKSESVSLHINISWKKAGKKLNLTWKMQIFYLSLTQPTIMQTHLVTVLGKCKMTLNAQCSRESSIRYQVFSRVCTQFPQSTDLDLNSHKNHQTGIFTATCIYTLFQFAI